MLNNRTSVERKYREILKTRDFRQLFELINKNKLTQINEKKI